MEDKSDKKSRREKRAEEERKAKDRARGDRNRNRDNNNIGSPRSMPSTKPSRGDERAEEDRKAKDRARPRGSGGRDHHRDRDREAKSRARGNGGSAATPGAVAERKRDDDRVSRKGSSNRTSGSSRTRERDEKSKEKSRRGGGRQAVPGAVAEKNDDDTPMSPRERSRRRKEGQASSGPSPRDIEDRRERRRREKEKEASKNAVPAPPIHLNHEGVAGEEVPTAAAIDDDVETMQFEATTVPNNITEEQLEAARQEGREEGRNERNNKAKEADGDDGSVLEAAPAQKDNTAKKCAIAAFVIVVVVAGIVIWRVMFSGQSDTAQVGPTIFKPPTQDDCVAVSKGLAVSGQKEDSVRTFAVEMNFAVTRDMDLGLLQAELAIQSQRNVLPLLIGCAVEGGPMVVENNNFVITNANLEVLTMDSPKSCDLGSQSLCSFTYMEIDLFLKDPEVSSDYILELIAFVFEHKSLLEVLDMFTPIETIDTQREYEVLAPVEPVPSSLPSSRPSITITQPQVNPISDDECQNIADGKPVDGQQDLALQEYDIYMDVMLGFVMNDLTTVTRELEERLQRFLMPALVGCDPSLLALDSTQNRRLATEGLILNAVVQAEYLFRGLCLPEFDPPCYRYVIHLDIFVGPLLASADFTESLMAKFREEPLVPRLEFPSPFVKITVVDGVAQTPSAVPSFSPSANPTTQGPSQVPSVVPSTSPSQILSSIPSPQPTPRPTDQTSSPTPGPTPFPTASPTKFPTPRPTTKSPTKFPTPRPTLLATPNPTSSPKPCIQSNVDLTSAVYTWFTVRQDVEAQYGPIEDWCFGPGVTSMKELFYNRAYYFNADISKWDVSGITDMSDMFNGARVFNQNIGGWDVSSVTDMSGMFWNAEAFNQDIGGWNVSSVTNMRYMFLGASNFNHNLCAWDAHLSNSADVTLAFSNTNCPTTADPGVNGPFCHTC